MKVYEGGFMAPRILNLGGRVRWTVRFTPRPLCYPKTLPPPGTRWRGGSVGHRTGLGALQKI